MFVIPVVLALIQIALDYIVKKKANPKLHRILVWVLSCGIIVSALWSEYDRKQTQKEANTAMTKLGKQNDTLVFTLGIVRGQNDSSVLTLDIVRRQNDSLSRQLSRTFDTVNALKLELQPFADLAQELHPGQENTLALALLRNDMRSISQKVDRTIQRIKYIGSTKPQLDPKAGKTHQKYFFKADPATDLNDVRIQLLFRDPIDTALVDVQGAVVKSQGDNLQFKDGRRLLDYYRNFLSVGNTISIEVISLSAPIVTRAYLGPPY